MSSHDAFLQAIIENPDDDTHRLVYADWLDDHDEPRRAEFIRLQCRLAQMDEFDPEWADLLDREWELLSVYRWRWLPGAGTIHATCPGNCWFWRGFPGQVGLPTEVMLQHGAAVFRDQPIQELLLRECAGRLGDLAAQPWFARVTALEFGHGPPAVDDLRALLASRHLTNLRRLKLIVSDPECLELLAQWPGLGGLTQLTLRYEGRGQPGARFLRRLLELPHLRAATTLAMTAESPEVEVALLAHSPHFATLANFALDWPGDESLRRLADTTGLPALRHLALRNSRGSDDALAGLLTSPLVGRLYSLSLRYTSAGVGCFQALAAGPPLERLARLNLSRLDPEKARVLAAVPFRVLTELDLADNHHLGPEGMAALAAAPHLASLRWLCLKDCSVGTAGVEVLADAPTFANLRYLDLSANQLTGAVAESLARSPHRARLRHLSLAYSRIGARAASTLLGAANLAGLWSLDLTSSGLTDAAVRRALSKSPRRQLRRLFVDPYESKQFTAVGERLLATSPLLPHLLDIDRQGGFSMIPRDVSPVILEQGKGREL